MKSVTLKKLILKLVELSNKKVDYIEVHSADITPQESALVNLMMQRRNRQIVLL